MPIGIDRAVRTYVFACLVRRPSPIDFRAFLQRQAELLRALPAWRFRLLVPAHLERARNAFGMLNDRHGLREGARLAAALAKAADSALEHRHDRWLQLTSQYGTIPVETWTSIIQVLDRDAQTLRDTLRPLVALYTDCPFRLLWAAGAPDSASTDIQTVRQAVDALVDRRLRSATHVQANAIFLMFVTNKLSVNRGSVLERLEEIVEYPRTEESRLVASGVRAMINGLSREDAAAKDWTRYFWRRGLELSPCELLNEGSGFE